MRSKIVPNPPPKPQAAYLADDNPLMGIRISSIYKQNTFVAIFGKSVTLNKQKLNLFLKVINKSFIITNYAQTN
ncbi:hypothetical protein NPIL_546361 [Nephila pilipes]|uniref:Uncharacterized protein n=1 Tax=Nephila pilipes TaxID=299642 RepID=A0A8X6Q2Z7_NEPPI|nr:hypothetical protein NPIL_546361 [Nephila pilipes]